jgi:regulator of RNase E activity RraA
VEGYLTSRTDLRFIVEEFMKLSTPNVSDALDRLQVGGAPRGILPLWPACPRLVGPAATMKLLPPGKGPSRSPVIGTMEAVKAAQRGDILVIDNGGRTDANSYGGIAGFTTRHFGLAGCVIDGVTRDVDEIMSLNLPVYARGIIQTSIRNRCSYGGHGIEVQLAGVNVRPADLIMGDANGVLVIPKEHIKQVLEVAKDFKEMEGRIVEAIRNGIDPSEAHEKVRYDALIAQPTK